MANEIMANGWTAAEVLALVERVRALEAGLQRGIAC